MKPNPRLIHITLLTAILALLPAATFAQPGTTLWTNDYGMPNYWTYDEPSGVAVDSSGDVVVTGSSYNGTNGGMTIKYSNAGTPLWTNYSTQGGGPLAIDGTGNIYFFNRKLSPAGLLLWTNVTVLNGISALAVDSNGNAVVTGYVNAGVNNSDWITIKYSTAGVPLWTNRYDGPGTSRDYDTPRAVAMDGTGNVYVTGFAYMTNDQSLQYCATIKYSSSGVAVWTNLYPGLGNVGASPSAVVVDGSGNIVVAGGSGGDYFTVKYSSAGAVLWTNRYAGPDSSSDYAWAVAVDNSNNVYVTGTVRRQIDAYAGAFVTVAYSAAGIPLWTNWYSGGNTNELQPRVLVDESGRVYVSGGSMGSGTGYDFATIAYSPAGVPLWTNRFNGPANKDDAVKASALDNYGNIYVTGSVNNSLGYSDYVTIKIAGFAKLPIITKDPLSRTELVGTTTTFGVTAIGDAPLTYQWRKGEMNLLNDGRLSGVTTTNMVIANVQPGDAGDYTVVVTNFAGSVTSLVAQLTVISPGRITNFSYSPATGFTFVFRDATLGRPYRIQTSPSLAPGSWVDWVNFNYTAPIGFVDLSALDNTNRFTAPSVRDAGALNMDQELSP